MTLKFDKIKKINGISIYAPDLINNSSYMSSDNYQILEDKENSGFWWFKCRAKLICFLFNKYFRRSKTFCEIGCGGAYILSEVQKANPQLNCYGSEVHIKGLTIARKRQPLGQFFQADLLKFPYVEKFDTIGAFDVLEHIKNDILALNNIYSALKPGGGVIISVPQHKWLWSEKDTYSGHKRRYTRNELKEKLVAAGFSVVRMTSYTTLMLPLFYISRLFDKNNKNIEETIKREFEISPLTNRILSSISELELIITKMGINFPVGGSLFAICRKNTQND
jgi:SAM-dependent methyltransferase